MEGGREENKDKRTFDEGDKKKREKWKERRKGDKVGKEESIRWERKGKKQKKERKGRTREKKRWRKMFWQAGRGRSVHVHWTEYSRTPMNREHLNTTPESTNSCETSGRA